MLIQKIEKFHRFNDKLEYTCMCIIYYIYIYISLYAYLNIKNNSINIKNAYHALMIWYLCGNSMPIQKIEKFHRFNDKLEYTCMCIIYYIYIYISLYAYLNIKNNSINIKNAYHALMIWYLCGNSMPIQKIEKFHRFNDKLEYTYVYSIIYIYIYLSLSLSLCLFKYQEQQY